MKMLSKKVYIVGTVLLITIASLVFFLYFSRQTKTQTKVESGQFSEEEDDFDAIPTTEKNVQTSLEFINQKQKLKVGIVGIPGGTKMMDYELTYSTSNQGVQGVIGQATPKEDGGTFDSDHEFEITLGTCSSNVCTYHDLTGSIAVTIKFEGAYGAKLYRNEYVSEDL
jgi:hypothetical protein